jgi:hypothetical protein
LKRLLAIVALLALAACARHDDLPSALVVMEPPVPTDFTVSTDDRISFDLSWNIDDPQSIVSYYRFYVAVPPYMQVARLDTTVVDRSVTLVTEDGLPAPWGMTFCVSSVTTENVESRPACLTAD